MENKPIISNRDRKLSASVFKRQSTDENGVNRTVYSVCVQRSWKKKDSEEFDREQINLFPDDLLRFADLFTRTYRDILTYAQSQPKETKEYPAQSLDDEEIPFN